MNDQAEKLRQVINNLKIKNERLVSGTSERQSTRPARVIAVTSGKGGVGKTTLTLNLSIALSKSGYRVIILDADFGLANIEVLAGVSPQYTLLDVFNNQKSIVEILTDGPENIKFISCGSGVEELFKLQPLEIMQFINSISLLDSMADVIFIDTGAGVSENIIKILLSADEILLVLTPEPTSITDAYALIKMLSLQDRTKKINIVVNRADDVEEAEDILDKMILVAEKFLRIRLTPLGYVLKDESVVRSIKRQTPLALYYPNSRAAYNIISLSQKIAKGSEMYQHNNYRGIRAFLSSIARSMKY